MSAVVVLAELLGVLLWLCVCVLDRGDCDSDGDVPLTDEVLNLFLLYMYKQVLVIWSLAGKLSWDIPVSTTQVNSALHPSGVTKTSTSFGWGKGGKVAAAGCEVTLCDPMACDFP